MAKKIHTVQYYDDFFTADYFPANPVLGSHTKTKAVFTDAESGDSFVFTGEDFKYKNGMLQKGTIESMASIDNDVGTIVKYFNSHIDVSKIEHSSAITLGMAYKSQFEASSMKMIGSDAVDTLWGKNGKDTLLGKDGNDSLNGGKGKDVMTGGADGDLFMFYKGDGKDTITDFSYDENDRIEVSGWTEYDLHKDGRNTIIEFSKTDTLTLVGVKPNELHDLENWITFDT